MKIKCNLITLQVLLGGVMALMLGTLTACQSLSTAGGTFIEQLEEALANAPDLDQSAQSAPPAQSPKKSSNPGRPAQNASKPLQTKKPSQPTETKAVHVILQNKTSSAVTVELIDQYGGNFTATIDSGMTQNHTLRIGSSVKVNGATVHVIHAGDKGKMLVVAGS